MNVSFDFYYSGKKEKAPILPHSSGNSKKRLHLFGHQEKDRFAVAANQITSKDKSPPKLSWFGKKYYVLIPDPNSNGKTWYKVNKNSLKKRFQITEKELKPAIQNSSILNLIEEKYAARKQWEQIEDWYISQAQNSGHLRTPSSLPSRFIDALVNAGIKPGVYKGIVFWSSNRTCYCFTFDGCSPFRVYGEKDNNPCNLRNYEKGQILSIIFREPYLKRPTRPRENIVDPDLKADVEFVNGPDSPLTIIELDDASVKSIINTGEFPKKILMLFKTQKEAF